MASEVAAGISPRELEAAAFASAMLRAWPTTTPLGIIYRHFDAADVLLYIGITDDRSDVERQKSHARTARWWRFVHRIERETVPDRRAASRAEMGAIRAERPIFNRRPHDAGQVKREAAYMMTGHCASAPPPPLPRPEPTRCVALDLGEYLAGHFFAGAG